MTKRIQNTAFLELLPSSISTDLTVQAAAKALDGSLQHVLRDVPALLLFARLAPLEGALSPALQRLTEVAGGLKPLTEAELELLAWQFHVDFRETATTREQLATMVRESIPWHRIKGTPASIKRALGLFGYNGISIEEDGVGRHWATYQLGLPHIADIPTVQHIVKICNAMAPVRCRLWRIYTDTYDRRPIIWSGGTCHDRWSDGWWTMHSGVSVPDAPGSENNLIVSFGMQRSFQSQPYAPGDLVASFGASTRYGFLAPYLDRSLWGRSAWSDIFPRNHGFAMGSLFSILWADRATTGRRWRGEWDARSWLDYTGFDRKLPPWRMGQRALSRSHNAYSEGSRLSDINACYSRPTAVILDAPPVWGASRWSVESNKRHLLVIDERYLRVSNIAPKPVNPGIPQAAGASLLTTTPPVPNPHRVQQARHDKLAAHMQQREAVPPRSASQEFFTNQCVALNPNPALPSAITHYHAPQWLGAWTTSGRTWTTPRKITILPVLFGQPCLRKHVSQTSSLHYLFATAHDCRRP